MIEVVPLAPQTVQEYLRERKQILTYPNPPFSPGTTCRVWLWWTTCPGSSRCTPSGNGTCTVLLINPRAFRSRSSLAQAGLVPLNSTLKLFGIFLCFFIPWICFIRRALYWEMAAHVFRARLHQQLIQTGLNFSVLNLKQVSQLLTKSSHF